MRLRRLFGQNIEKLKERRDVEGLIRALKDSDWGVRWRAAEALGKIGDRRAVEPLIEALEDIYEDVRREAAKALGEIGDGRAVEPLIRALKDSDWFVQRKAAEALKKIALNTINEVHSLLQQAKKLGINTEGDEKKLNEAKLKLQLILDFPIRIFGHAISALKKNLLITSGGRVRNI